MRQNVWLILLLAGVLGVGGALALSLKAPGGYEKEWVQALLQTGLIAVLGAVTSLVLARFNDALQQRRDDGKLRFDVLTDLTEGYMKVKLVRRKLQARKLQAGNSFTATETDQLNEVQVRIETHKHNSVRLFRETSALEGHLKTMEHYLNEVANNPSSKEGRGFISKEGFRVFSQAFRDAADLIRAEITLEQPAKTSSPASPKAP